MEQAPIPANEEERIKAVQALNILDTPPDERFDEITKAATRIFHVPISTVTIVDKDREWYKSCQGLPTREGERAISFCGHTISQDRMLVIEDTKKDERFADNPMVVGPPHIRFYAGVPISDASGNRIGAFCIKDHQPRQLTPSEEEMLLALATWCEAELLVFQLQNSASTP